jgi:exopolysaccharide biosynthesis polyprenyl glycosylphosphotransferase
MRKRDTFEVMASSLAVIMDGLAVFAGFLLATWLRFGTDWIPLRHEPPPNFWPIYLKMAGVVAILHLIVFRALGLFVRPQTGAFAGKVPRLIRGATIGTLLAAVLAFAMQNVVDIARAVVALSFVTTLMILITERAIFFRIERHMAKHSPGKNRVLILGTDTVAAHVMRTLKREHMLRSKVVGFIRTDHPTTDASIAPTMILGPLDNLPDLLESQHINQVILTDSSLGHDRIVALILLCEKNLVQFNMVPDLFRIMTTSMDVQSLDDIPLLGLSKWPLDFFWNRCMKRIEDIAGATFGLIILSPLMLLAAIAVKLTSPGPIFFRQERCGQNGRSFNIFKLRTMRTDAEAGTGPVFTAENDPRVTPVGRFLRRNNIDELPQLWNVFLGDMSLIGPRPERPHFVEKFREDINRYMWRHVSKPGMTGWAQVNGLRGNTSIEERIKYDLYYLENWSLALDFKIIVRTLFARENAY